MNNLIRIFKQYIQEEEIQAELVYSEYYGMWMYLDYETFEYESPHIRMIAGIKDLVHELMSCVAFRTCGLPGFNDSGIVSQMEMVRAELRRWISFLSYYISVPDDMISEYCLAVIGSIYN